MSRRRSSTQQLDMLKPSDAFRLHRLHAAPCLTGCSLDIGPVRWRPADGGTWDEKTAQAHRLALVWNLCEGLPTAALEAGHLARQADALEALLEAWASGEDLVPHVAALNALRDSVQDSFDVTEGRLHDCESCLAADAELEPSQEAGVAASAHA